MKLSEKNSYMLAVIIVILGTMTVAAGFMIGLLSLTRTDVRVESSFDVKILSPDARTEIMSEDYVVSGDKIDGPRISSKDTGKGAPKMKILTSTDLIAKGGRWIFIDKGKFTLTLYDRDIVERKWKIAVGIIPGDKQRKGDNRTPNGVFKIMQIQDASSWTHDFDDGNGEIEGAYGPWFIRLHTPPWKGIGIHGTHDPDSINSRASEGCIRMSNKDVSELKKLVELGMPVLIVE